MYMHVSGFKEKRCRQGPGRSLVSLRSLQLPRSDSLQVKFAAAPVFGSDIGDGFGEVPAVTVKVLSVVLALAIRVVLGFTEDRGAILPRALAVALGIFNTNLNRLRMVGRDVSFGDGEAALSGFHLDAVIGDAQPDREAKSL